MAQLTLHSGQLGRRLAAHLLRRTTHQISPARIKAFGLKTAEAAVDELLQPSPLLHPDGPLYHGNGLPIFELGGIGRGTGQVDLVINRSSNDLYPPFVLWRIYETTHCPTAQWRITQWLSSLFNLNVQGGPRYQGAYHFWRLLHYISFKGSLKDLANKMSIDNNMLSYLNNEDNRVNFINENYAREFLELFTILKGPVRGLGDYTNYTEADITTAAEVLTGWRRSNNTIDSETGIATGKPFYNRHDKNDKTFSAAFQNTTIVGATSEQDMYRELSDFVDMVFNQKETARAYVRKMYRFFVNDIIDSEIEADIIEPLADDLYNNDYQFIPVLKRLLKSLHFYDLDDSNSTDSIIGGKIKSPMELFCSSVNLLNVEHERKDDLTYYFSKDASFAIELDHFRKVGMDPRGPDTVEGYPGYYDQAQGYSRAWFKSNNVFERYTFGNSFKRGKVRNGNRYFPYKVDLIAWTSENIDGPEIGTPAAPRGAADAYNLVNNMLDFFLCERPKGPRYQYFLQALLGGLSPINWYFSWKEYRDLGMIDNVQVGLERFYDAIMASPEYQTF